MGWCASQATQDAEMRWAVCRIRTTASQVGLNISWRAVSCAGSGPAAMTTTLRRTESS